MTVGVLFQIVDGHVLKLNLLGTIDVSCISENAYGHARPGNVGESSWMKKYESTNTCAGGEDVLHSSGETLVSLGIVVFQTNLQLDRLHKVTPFLAGGFGEELFDGAPHA